MCWEAPNIHWPTLLTLIVISTWTNWLEFKSRSGQNKLVETTSGVMVSEVNEEAETTAAKEAVLTDEAMDDATIDKTIEAGFEMTADNTVLRTDVLPTKADHNVTGAKNTTIGHARNATIPILLAATRATDVKPPVQATKVASETTDDKADDLTDATTGAASETTDDKADDLTDATTDRTAGHSTATIGPAPSATTPISRSAKYVIAVKPRDQVAEAVTVVATVVTTVAEETERGNNHAVNMIEPIPARGILLTATTGAHEENVKVTLTTNHHVIFENHVNLNGNVTIEVRT